MRYKVQPEDFAVEEHIRLPLASGGRFAVYRVHKRGVTTLRVQAQMARALGVPQSDVVFPALKDKDAVSTQHAAVRGTGPARLSRPSSPEEEEGGRPRNGFVAELVGRSERPLTPADIVANRFTVVLRDLPAQGAAPADGRIEQRIAQVARFGLPNYFDQQRFGSLVPGEEHIAKRILRRDAEGALRAYLTQPFSGDPAPVRAFKAFAADHWGDWEGLFEAAPRPSNYRSVLTYLRDHPPDGSAESATYYRKAVNLITRRLLSIYLSAYQSLLWNRIAARYLAARLGAAPEDEPSSVEIASEHLPIYRELPTHLGREIAIPLPNHRADYTSGPLHLAAIAADVLAEEGLALRDLKARILNKAYLTKGQRALLLFPQELSASPPEPDDRFPGRNKLTLAFTLPRGSYATLVIKALSV